MPWGTPNEVAERIIEEAEAMGTNTVLVSMNRGAMPKTPPRNRRIRLAAGARLKP